MIRKPTSEQIKAYREQHGVGLHDAKAALMKVWRTENLQVFHMQATVLGMPEIALAGLLEYLMKLESEK